MTPQPPIPPQRSRLGVRPRGGTLLSFGEPVGGRLLLLALLALLVPPAPATALGPRAEGSGLHRADRSRQYVDAAGQPLPFTDDDQILQFLATAKIVGEQPAPKGINRIRRLTLERNGVRAYAAFRDIDETRQRHRLPNGKVASTAKDSYRYDPAAYWVDRLLGLDLVPPAVLRRHGRKRGSLQLWIGNVIDEQERLERELAPHALLWHRQSVLRNLFDNLIANYDRNQTNILVDPETWRLWLIDHGRAFLRDARLLDAERVTSCERGAWERLRALDEQTAKEHLEPFLDRWEIQSLLERRDVIVERIEQLIAERGEAAVLFDLTTGGATQ